MSSRAAGLPTRNADSWIGPDSEGPFQIAVDGDAAFLCGRKRGSSRACGILWSGGNARMEGLARECAIRLGVAPEDLEWRVVGQTRAAQICVASLKQLGLAVVNTVSRPEPFVLWFWPNAGKLLASKAKSTPAAQPELAEARVLVVDDSKTIRTLLSKVLSSDAEIRVVGTADHPNQVEELIRTLRPNVITLDIHMPEMDGVTLLKRIFPKYRIPTIMISSLRPEDGPEVLEALEAGAVDYIEKPQASELSRLASNICEKIKAAARSNAGALSGGPKPVAVIASAPVADLDPSQIVLIGSSTGGTEALRALFMGLPANIPPMLVVQHIPAVFSAALAKRLDGLCPFEVREARDGDELKPGCVLIAPGGKQMKLVSDRGAPMAMRIRVDDSAPVARHKPSVDALFDSAADIGLKRGIAVILTGMGADGARGMLRLRNGGMRTIAQSEKSCVVFGMPREAIRLGGAEEVHDLDRIAPTLVSWLTRKKGR